jgi:ABC-2 type transport system permease protein
LPTGIEVHLLYNPQMKGAYNFVPGVMGLILMLICSMMTSVGIVKEKEIGTLEVLLVSPMKPVYIVLAKATPYLLISMINIATILLLSRFLLDVPIVGNLALLVGLSLLYTLVSLCLGLLISTIADTQQAAMLISGIALMLPVVLLSGMIFPIENMPRILQVLSDIVPAKWYIIAVKDVMIKGLGLGAILKETGILALMAVALAAFSVKRFKIRL